jgi:2,3-bisphosphoglycerate-independent phosphoglycerate mutase
MVVRPSTRGAPALARAVRELYSQGQSDYALEPVVLVDQQGCPVGRIASGDAVIFCCRRGEREVQLTEAFTDPDFSFFPRPPLHDLGFVILTLYHEKFRHLPVAFAPTRIEETLAEIVSRAGLRQLHVAESEKFSHVTFFFNGGNSQPFPGEQDLRIPSPTVSGFDQMPEMSLPQVAEQVMQAIQDQHDLIVTNFANGDVIGHTSNDEAKIRCASLLDHYLGQVVDAAALAGYAILVTADHGNLEVMRHADGSPHVAHTANPVPFLPIDPRLPITNVRDGRLADVAPTVLAALGWAQPPTMNGSTLISDHDWGSPRRVLLVILDGWGIGAEDTSNPIYLASTPCWDKLLSEHPHSRLQAAGTAVGLEPGKSGNSEAGHMNLGAGRVILQDDVRLDQAMQDGSFYHNNILLDAIGKAKERGGALHLLCLLSEKSSHGSIEYPLAILRMARDQGLERAFLHVIFDGRSTEPGSAPDLLLSLESRMNEIGLGQLATGIGRGIALDRDRNYEKTRRAFEAFVNGSGRKVPLD